MENASKALIIAGAILLAIAIIGIGMFVYQSVTGTIQDAANMSDQEVDAYNQEFLNYEGVVKGSAARALCDAVRNHNVTNRQDPSKQIAVKDGEATDPMSAPKALDSTGTTSSEINEIKADLLSGKTYTVTVGYDNTTGLITNVGIKLTE